jgi:hypothetical protein
MTEQATRYAIAGTGSRATLYIDAICGTYPGHSPWEGPRVAITGDKGRLELYERHGAHVIEDTPTGERAASHLDGAASVLPGAAANRSMTEGRPVTIGLPE